LRPCGPWGEILSVKRTIWTNHTLQPAAEEHLRHQLAVRGHRLLSSKSSSRSVLLAGEADPSLAEADIAYGQPCPRDILAHPSIRWVALSTAGHARYDALEFRAAMKERGTVVTNASAVFADPCAQHVIAGMLALARNLPSQLRNQDGPRDWRYLEDRFTASVLTGRSVVILGFGAIGRRLAELLAPWGLRMVGFRRRATGDETIPIVTGEDALLEALQQADHVINTLPDSSTTRGFLDQARLSRFKPGARFYNIGRGTTVDQDALIQALERGSIGAAYLDVMDPEPLPPDHPLWEVPNCHLTCHVGGGTVDQDDRLARHFLGNLDRLEAGQPLIDRIFS